MREESTLPDKIKNSLHIATRPVKGKSSKNQLLLLANLRLHTIQHTPRNKGFAPPTTSLILFAVGRIYLSLLMVFYLQTPREAHTKTLAGYVPRDRRGGQATEAFLDPVPHDGFESGGYAMLTWLKELDDVLRGRKAEPDLLASGTAHIHIKPLVLSSLTLGVVYGVFMGLYAVATRTPPRLAQTVASAVKVPVLFFLTLVITFPSLYVFSALMGVRLGPKDTFRLILVPIAVNLAVLASLGPIVGFFTLSTTSYHFMKLLNFLFFALSGVIGLKVLLTMLSRIEQVQSPQEPVPPAASAATDGVQSEAQTPAPTTGQLSHEQMMARRIFQVWLVIYALVGAQMGWVLRPFIGSPSLKFEWFRDRQANIFIDILRTIGNLLSP